MNIFVCVKVATIIAILPFLDLSFISNSLSLFCLFMGQRNVCCIITRGSKGLVIIANKLLTCNDQSNFELYVLFVMFIFENITLFRIGARSGQTTGFLLADSMYGKEGDTADLISPPLLLPKPSSNQSLEQHPSSHYGVSRPTAESATSYDSTASPLAETGTSNMSGVLPLAEGSDDVMPLCFR